MICAMATGTPFDSDLKQALARHQAGDLAAAELLFGQALDSAPDHPVALQHLGVIALQQGRTAEGTALLQRAAAASPDDPGIQFNLALALRALDRVDEAAAHYQRAIALAPGFADAHVNLANLQRSQGRLEAAESGYRRALAVAPQHAGAHNNLGALLQDLGSFEAAIAAHRQALALNPRNEGAHSNLGNALFALGRCDAAIAAFRQALALNPALPHALLGLANALRQSGDLEGAVAALEAALAARPGHAETLSQLVHWQQALCRWDGLAARQAAVVEAVEAGAIAVPFTLLSLPSTPAQQQTCARAWMAKTVAGAQPIAPDTRPAGGLRAAPIRIGYLSSDYHEHPTAYLIAELLERHDRRRFTITGYSIGPNDGGPSGRRIVAACDAFVDLETLPHDEAARRIAADRIDILVDLNGCTMGARPRILAHRPAPLQVNYLGYPGTMGAGFMDYIVVDPIVAPPDEQPWFDERLVHLPHSYQVNDSRRPVAATRPTREAAGLPDDGFVFCCFNSSYKLRPEFLEIWLRLLAATPGSVLWLLELAPTASARLRQTAQARGIDPRRLVFAPSVRFPEHLARQPLADLCLDTLPYGGHTTASDALWSGVPLVTCRGPSFPGRVGASLLSALGLTELITGSLAEYEDLALALASEPGRLTALRARLRAARDSRPLYDCARFAGDLERAYEAMMVRYDAGLAPAPIRIEPT
jgi:predicted O-linked N-acetylglucosamine transferase (SPINDLY family)